MLALSARAVSLVLLVLKGHKVSLDPEVRRVLRYKVSAGQSARLVRRVNEVLLVHEGLWVTLQGAQWVTLDRLGLEAREVKLGNGVNKGTA